jgi:hypothetical protein
MSRNLHEFLEEAKAEVEASQFDLDVAAGRISEAEMANRVRFVGQPESPLVVHFGFRTMAAWAAHYSGLAPCISEPLRAPPELVSDRQ